MLRTIFDPLLFFFLFQTGFVRRKIFSKLKINQINNIKYKSNIFFFISKVMLHLHFIAQTLLISSYLLQSQSSYLLIKVVFIKSDAPYESFMSSTHFLSIYINESNYYLKAFFFCANDVDILFILKVYIQ